MTDMIDFDTMKLLYVLQDEMHEIQRRLTIIDRKLTEIEKKEKDDCLRFNDSFMPRV